MGKKNNVMCEYLARPEIFADFLNAGYFGGEKRILPEELYDCGQVTYDNKGTVKSGERSRDVVKACYRGTKYAIIGVENQQSGMKKEDKLTPVVTIVFYHGTKRYDGCRKLHDMLDLEGENVMFTPYVADYKMNLISPDDILEEKCETGLRDLIGFLKCREDKNKIQMYCKRNAERIRNMDEDTFDTISEMINSKELIRNKEKYRETERGCINMCKAMEDWAEELKAEGKAEGMLEGIKAVIEICRELGTSQEEAIQKIVEKFLFTRQEAGSYIEKYWKY